MQGIRHELKRGGGGGGGGGGRAYFERAAEDDSYIYSSNYGDITNLAA